MYLKYVSNVPLYLYKRKERITNYAKLRKHPYLKVESAFKYKLEYEVFYRVVEVKSNLLRLVEIKRYFRAQDRAISFFFTRCNIIRV